MTTAWTTAVFFPDNHLDRLLTTSLSFLKNELSNDINCSRVPTVQITPPFSYILADYTLVKLKYHGRPVLVPKKGSQTIGRLLLVNQDGILKVLDSVFEEGTMYYRLLAQGSSIGLSNSSPDPPLHPLAHDLPNTVQVYAWNGNCIIGEWEYL